MEQYRTVFTQADKLAAGVLSQIAQGANAHIEVTAQKYDSLVKMFDEHISVVVQKLGGSIEELREYMEDLSEAVQEARKSMGEQPRGGDGRRT
jgi:hypothetical protein